MVFPAERTPLSCDDAPPNQVAGTTSWIPLAGYAVAMAFATIAYLKLGHWPYYSHPDPKYLQLPYLHGAALIGALLAHLSLLIVAIALMVSRAGWKKHHAIILALGAVLWAAEFVRSEHVANWLAD